MSEADVTKWINLNKIKNILHKHIRITFEFRLLAKLKSQNARQSASTILHQNPSKTQAVRNIGEQ